MIMATHKEPFVVRNLAPVLISQTIPLAGEGPPPLLQVYRSWRNPSHVGYLSYYLQLSFCRADPVGILNRHFYVNTAPVVVGFLTRF